MTADTLLTVGIPTFNRADAVIARVRELISLREEMGFQILVIDNGSTDGTSERLARELDESEFILHTNSENIGYGRNLMKVIKSTRTPYLTVVSDEDRVERDGLRTLIKFLAETRPRLVSPRAQVRDDDAYRGRRETRTIRPEEYENASFYLSGLTFEVEATLRDLELVESRISTNEAALFYPQVLLTALALLDDRCIFLDSLVTRQVVELRTAISDGARDSYWFVPSRWRQFEGFEEFFTVLEELRPARSEAVRSMRGKTRSGILSLIESAAIAQFPDLKDTRLQPNLLQRVAMRLLGR